TPPELSTVTIASGNTTNTAYATNGDTVTLDLVANEAIDAPTVIIGGIAATSVTNTSGDQVTWRASRAVSASDIGIVEDDPIAFSINYQDVLGNTGVTVTATTAPATSVIFDSLAPTLTIGNIDPTLTSLETITVTFTFNEDVTGFDETDIDITNGAYEATTFNAMSAREYSANITPTGTGDLTFTVAVISGKAVDAAGNGNAAASVTATIEPFWQLVWSDTFDVAGIDATLWNVRTNTDCPTPCDGNQDYLASRVSVTGDGVLRIQAVDDADGGAPYESGLIDTRGNESLRYGRIEIDAILPSTTGSIPSLWLLPEPAGTPPALDGAYGPWPLSGEIDIVNAFDLSGNVKHSLVYGLPEGEETTTTGTSAFVAGGVPHEYAIEWEAGEIRWFVDGTHVATQLDDNWYAYYPDANGVFTLGTNPEPFDQEFYLLISLAVGSPTGAFDETLQIQEVRVYECFAGNPVDGTGCSTGTGIAPVPVTATAPYTEEIEVYTDAPGILDFEDDAGDLTLSSLVTDNSAGVTSMTNVAEPGRGNVWHVNIPAPGAASGFVAMQPGDFTMETGYFDLTGGETAGEVLFDLRVNASTTAGTQISVGLDSDVGNSREVLDYTADGVWRPYSVKIADLVAGSFFRGGSINIANLLNAFVLEASGGTADLDLDNIFLKVACRDTGGCEATPRLAPETVPPTVVYSQNFEGTAGTPIPDGDNIGDNWVFFVNVFPAGSDIPRFGYGQPAPNGPQISALVTDQGGPSQGGQQLSVYSDYECCPGDFFNPPTGHQNGTDTVETNVFAELLITAADIGAVFTFSFDAKAGNIGGVSTANGFVKVLQEVEAGAPGPAGNDFFVVAEENVDTTSLSTEWSRPSVEITITSDMIGGADVVDVTLQFGFQTNGVNFSNTNNYYDNVELTRAVP
ncbi:MAG: glycoside hydrolase family 16 protein, partial [Gammaproteobacteria bacterium]|nr:glycoside hydrolase family 16 protein [Gammaproteobacteria bacterium]